ncbi:DSD1 family PLP-dependent enzyme [Legionella hackeliae]|uniref:Metal-activated pyridoxal enzyme n=1 Tax=Legionella hackeliae TaxID=449 RepID=A0A0A8USK0_LEGHA|nr:DSD1 family PLP-dependent enzyme [Legionella hackeliae]KTD10248.1 metal-activated pyridoxal enzyme [Legionella hackeliae]CEK09744.1 Metal-activated pyridoxal enzyme [Legionella hackeliae]STX49654.1 metal-activated pyridoxal enzyme [Legionella hackeliae]
MIEQFLGLNKFQLDTPCLVIDREKLHHNLKRMQQHGLQYGINIRPHCKTHKCTALAKLQLEYGAIGISAAKISEAEGLINQGIQGVLVTSPVVTPYKITRLLNCFKQAPDSLVVTDNQQNIVDLELAAANHKQVINVLIDIDPGLGRTGVKPSLAIELAKKIEQSRWLNFKGIQCYAGNLQHIASYDERKISSLQIMEMASDVVKELRKQGIPCEILTGSGTGTYDIDIGASEVTEIQPGSYTVMDVEYAAIGSEQHKTHFHTFLHAMTLLTTVISSNRAEHVTVDAGTKSLYVDKKHFPKIISHPNLDYDWGGFGDEQGKITSRDGQLPGNGEVLELIVPHCDPTINLFDKFYIVSNDTVIDVWDINLRGASQ